MSRCVGCSSLRDSVAKTQNAFIFAFSVLPIKRVFNNFFVGLIILSVEIALRTILAPEEKAFAYCLAFSYYNCYLKMTLRVSGFFVAQIFIRFYAE